MKEIGPHIFLENYLNSETEDTEEMLDKEYLRQHFTAPLIRLLLAYKTALKQK